MQHQRMVGFAVKALSNQIRRNMDHSTPERRCCHGGGHHRFGGGEGEPLTGIQFAVIGYLGCRADRDVFQRDVEQEFGVRRSTATGILQLMEKNGLLYREPVPMDARLKKLVLTPKATHLHGHIHGYMMEFERQLIRGIPPEELDVFFAVIDKINRNLEYAAEDNGRHETPGHIPAEEERHD